MIPKNVANDNILQEISWELKMLIFSIVIFLIPLFLISGLDFDSHIAGHDGIFDIDQVESSIEFSDMSGNSLEHELLTTLDMSNFETTLIQVQPQDPDGSEEPHENNSDKPSLAPPKPPVFVKITYRVLLVNQVILVMNEVEDWIYYESIRAKTDSHVSSDPDEVKTFMLLIKVSDIIEKKSILFPDEITKSLFELFLEIYTQLCSRDPIHKFHKDLESARDRIQDFIDLSETSQPRLYNILGKLGK